MDHQGHKVYLDPWVPEAPKVVKESLEARGPLDQLDYREWLEMLDRRDLQAQLRIFLTAHCQKEFLES
jgi:hypothetical protein